MIDRVGAWTGTSTLRRPARDVAAAVEMGLTDLHLMICDHSASRRPRRYTTYSRPQIVAAAAAARDAGLRVHLTTWAMPHADYLAEMADVVGELASRTEAASVCLDLEEPWIRATRPIDYQTAGALVGTMLGVPLRVEGRQLGASTIVYTSRARVAPVAAWCDYLAPQAYATDRQIARWGVTPRGLPRTAVARTSPMLADGARIVMGLAGYRTEPEAMLASLESCEDLGVAEVAYWSLSHLRSRPALAAVVRGIRGGVA